MGRRAAQAEGHGWHEHEWCEMATDGQAGQQKVAPALQSRGWQQPLCPDGNRKQHCSVEDGPWLGTCRRGDTAKLETPAQPDAYVSAEWFLLSPPQGRRGPWEAHDRLPMSPQLPAILSQRGLGSAAIHLPTLAQEGDEILGARCPRVSHPGKRATK